MKKGRVSEDRIIAALRKIDGGAKPSEVAREVGVSHWTICNWRKRYGSMNESEAKKLKSLEAENAKLKRLVSDLSLDNLVLKDALGKK